MPHTSSVPLLWRLRKNRYGLIGTTCLKCDSVFFPPRPTCPVCGRVGKIKQTKLSGLGGVVSFTKINTAPKGFEAHTPYFIGVIKLDEGPTVTAQIITDVPPEIGKKVVPTFRKIQEDGPGGLITYGIKYKPA